MKFRSTILLLVVALGVTAYMYFVESKSKTTGEQADIATHVVDFDQKKIDSISLRSPETKIELRKKENGVWVMEEPAKDRADSVAVAELLTTLDTLHSDAAVEVDPKNKEQLKEYGVVDSTTKAKFTGGGSTIELILGKDAAVEGKCYVYVDGAKHVHAVENSLKGKLQKKGDDFRDRRLADFGATQVTKAEIKSSAGVLELTKINNHWNITKPLQARGDDSKINDLIAQLLTAHVDEFGSEVNLAISGLSEPRGTVTFTQEGVEKPVVLSIGANPKEEKDKEKTWAKLSTRDALVLVPKAIERAITTLPNDLRDKNLVRVESDIVDRITVEPAGGAKFVLGRKGESWVEKAGGKDVPINAAMAPKLLNDLQGAQVIDFVSDVATDLPKYGLDQPSLTVTFSSFASENTSETNAGDKPIVAVLFGKTEDAKVYAKLDNEPFIVSVSPNLTDGLPKSAIELQELSIFNDKAEEVTGLEVTKEGQPPLSLEKDKENKWNLTKGDGKVEQQAVSTLAGAMAQLRAVRWVGPVKPEHGFDKPTATLVATLTQGGQKVTRKLTIGAMKDELWNAGVEGRDGTFQIGKPDHDLLATALTDQPAPTPPPAAAAVPTPQPMPQAPDAKAAPKGLPPGLTSPANLTTPLGQPAGSQPTAAPVPAPAAPVPPVAPVPAAEAPAAPVPPPAAPAPETPAATHAPPPAAPAPAPATPEEPAK